MFHGIDPRSAIPLYAQIAERIRLAIANGTLSSAAALPSVRQLAGELRINPATVTQAYRELEEQGFVEIRHGAGTFVRELAPGRRARERSQQAVSLVRKLLAEARRSGVSLAELQRALEGEGEVAEQSPAVGGPLAVLPVPDLRPFTDLLPAVPLPPADLHHRRHLVHRRQCVSFVAHLRHDLFDVNLTVELHRPELVVRTPVSSHRRNYTGVPRADNPLPPAAARP